ncbi:MAG TPA: hypothetical protein VJ023_18160 [Pyrinomonadaceae bacterium]|nr:hypothetical protein [Pyrinomonadaceae bacterium]
MANRVKQMLVVLLITAFASVAAIAKSKSETVTFLTDMKVNGTLVKKGTYKIKFDEETSELSIIKNGKVIAKAPARVEQREKKARMFEIRSSGSGDTVELTAVAFGGSSENLVVAADAAQHSPKN